jgi:Ca-activated chloride channel family protein
MINYFAYQYPEPTNNDPFSVTVDAHACPWQPEHRLVRIGLKARSVAEEERPECNLVFLIDVSGSMDEPNKLPLVQRSLDLLVRQLAERDRVALVVYAGAAGLVLDSTECRDREVIRHALSRLRAGGSTAGGQGLELAYWTAVAHFIPGGVNRVILCTDGDFNVGLTSVGDLTRLISEKARSGVFLTVLGFGMGNYKDATLEKLADLGNGQYGYIDTLKEARRLLVEQMNGTLVTVAKDVKIQVEFNPARASAYRLIGYENRVLAKEDFNDDTKDAGDIGAGHTVTAFYEVIPPGRPIPALSSSNEPAARVDPLKYQAAPLPSKLAGDSPELLTIKLRYKTPDGATSQLVSAPFQDAGGSWETAAIDFKFAAGVAAFGMILRQSEHRGAASLDLVRRLAGPEASTEYRAEFLALVELAGRLLALKAGSASLR